MISVGFIESLFKDSYKFVSTVSYFCDDVYQRPENKMMKSIMVVEINGNRYREEYIVPYDEYNEDESKQQLTDRLIALILVDLVNTL